ncbi:MAG: shikimate dehydrogenase [Candidatus Dormibacteraeota bacterium]|nr:shikimate dehydrogenase [Candidatus Dormibacteraeota bacterium]
MATGIVALLGQGISYSASPALQAAAFAATNLDWHYELVDVAPSELAAAVEHLRQDPYRGANVTIPHKVAVMPMLNALEADARGARAVNTIRREGRRLIGSNTDVTGLRAALGAAGVEVTGATAVVLGAGGAARACGLALSGAAVTFVARNPSHAVGLPGTVLSWGDPTWQALARRADVLINATPLGRRGEMPIRPGGLPLSGAVIDLVYVAGGTPLVRRSRRLGLRCVDGWSILLAQGAAAFQAWTGREAPLAAMRAALPPGAIEAAGKPDLR